MADHAGRQSDWCVARHHGGDAAPQRRGRVHQHRQPMLGLRGGEYVAAYGSAKHALVGLTQSLANELALQWIRVRSVHPGNIVTPMIDNDVFPKKVRPDLHTLADAAEVIGAYHLLPAPLIEARAVNDAVLFLASDEARFITGAALPVDAGEVAKF